jgi:hypothetical protein
VVDRQADPFAPLINSRKTASASSVPAFVVDRQADPFAPLINTR